MIYIILIPLAYWLIFKILNELHRRRIEKNEALPGS